MASIKIPKKIKYNGKVKTGLSLLLIVILAIVFTNSAPILRYVKYLIFPLLIALSVLQKNAVFKIKRVDGNFILYTFLWIIACIFSLLCGWILDGPGDISLTRFFKELYFTSSALISIILLFNISSTASIKKGLSYFVILSFISVFIINYKKILALASYQSSIFYFVTPPTETFLATVYGCLFIYFLIEKNKKMAFICLLLTLIGAKRIIYIDVFVTTFLYFVLKPFKKLILANKTVIAATAVMLNLLIAFFLYKLAEGAFDEIIFQLTGIPPNWLFSGRVAMYKDVFAYIDTIPWMPKGLGFIGTILEDKHIHYNDFFVHMHSDVLKYIIEFGVLVFIIVLGFMYLMSLKNYYAFIMMVYFNIYMLTDNPSILYEFYILFFIVYMLMLKKKDVAITEPVPAALSP